jgi:molybdopterin biosynthesis enzyme
VTARFAWQRKHGKWLVLPGWMQDGGVERIPYAGSGDLLAYARANAQILLPPERTQVIPGESVDVIEL